VLVIVLQDYRFFVVYHFIASRSESKMAQEVGREVRFFTKVCGERPVFLLDFLHAFLEACKAKSRLRASILKKTGYPPDT
jgi:hypothetical protein